MDPSRQEQPATDPSSLRQHTPNAHSPSASCDTAQDPPATGHLNEKTGVYEHSCELESQSTTQNANSNDDPHTPIEETEYGPERLGQMFSRVRPSTWWFAGALQIAIPLSVFATVAKDTNLSGVKVTGFILWLEIVWTVGWFIYLLIWLAGKSWSIICRKRGLMEWDDFLLDTSMSQLLFFLSLVAWGSSWMMCRFSDGTCDVHWLHLLRKVLLATIPATGIFLVKNLLLEVIITRQASRILDTRKDIILRQFQVFSLIIKIFLEEPEQSLSTKFQLLLQNIKNFKFRFQVLLQNLQAFFQVELSSILIRPRSPPTHNYDSRFTRYLDGNDRDEDFEVDNKTFVDQMRDQCRENYRSILTDADDNFKEDINEDFFRDKLNLPHVKKMNESLYISGGPITAKEMLKMLDKDGSGEIELEEWVEASVETFMAVRDLNRSIEGIFRAANSVDLVMSCILLCIVAILYAAFFTNRLSSYLTPIWTTVTGLSFALGGTVTEFISACGFVFSKQPYDIGDRVFVQDKDLIVDEICLLYTVFHRVSDGAIEQIAHKVICDSWITNLSRSRSLSVKESAVVPESADTISKPILDGYQAALGNFIKENPVRSRYLNVNDFQISLQAGKDGGRQIVAVIKLRELIVRREDILAGVRNEVRDKLEELVRMPLAAS